MEDRRRRNFLFHSIGMNLVNDLLIKSGILARIAQPEHKIAWFAGVKAIDLIVSFMLPLIIVIIVAFMLKKRYISKKTKTELTLNADADTDTVF